MVDSFQIGKLLLIIPLIFVVIGGSGQAHSETSACNSAFIDSFESLLRNQSELLTGFDSLLNGTKPSLSIEQKMEFITSFEDLLRRQAILHSGFEHILKIEWDCLPADGQDKYLASFEDLLDRETLLFSRFQKLIAEDQCNFTKEENAKLLNSSEDLLRRQAILLNSFEELFKMKIGGIGIEKSADTMCILRGDKVTYIYQITNWFNKTLYNVTIIDSNLGIVGHRFDLKAKEIRVLSKTASINGDTCNTAKVVADDGKGLVVTAKSNVVCVSVEDINYNTDFLKVGDQSAMTMGGDPPSAKNSLMLKKNQKSAEKDERALVNTENVIIGNQAAFGNKGESVNEIKIVAGQE